MKNFESKIFEKIEITGIYEKATKEIEIDRINPDDFIDLYDTEKDKKYVAEMEQKFAKNSSPDKQESLKLATIFEAIVHQHAELSDWLGPNASTIKTSKYDDIKNGVDSIVEIKEGEKSAS